MYTLSTWPSILNRYFGIVDSQCNELHDIQNLHTGTFPKIANPISKGVTKTKK